MARTADPQRPSTGTQLGERYRMWRDPEGWRIEVKVGTSYAPVYNGHGEPYFDSQSHALHTLAEAIEEGRAMDGERNHAGHRTPTKRRRRTPNHTGLSPTELSGAIHRAKVLTAAKKIPPTVRRAGPTEPAPSAWASMAGTTWMRIEVYERIGSRIQRVDQFNVMAATPQIAQRYAIAQHLLDARRPLSDARRFDTIVKRG